MTTPTGGAASGERDLSKEHEYFYETNVEDGSAEAGEATVQLRLTWKPNIFAFSKNAGAEPLPQGSWEYAVRTNEAAPEGDRVREPFAGDAAETFAECGPWDPLPPEMLDPRRAAFKVLVFVSDWRKPPAPLTEDQKDWFLNLGPNLAERLSASGEEGIELKETP